ncbi:MAG: hypothetical protein B0W54_19285 [Cellvibrio sp. 79]|nr:MAG: hypothetical protein B0W54_19285 [Cellvibrio sp. 79]
MKKIFFLSLFFIGAAVVGYLFNQSTTEQSVSVAPENPVAQTTEGIASHSSIQASASPKEPKSAGRQLTATEMAVKNEWLRNSGQSTADLETYEHYSDEQLANLAEQGDFNAMHVLGIRKLASEGVNAAIPLAQKEIVYGSLRGITTMANYTSPNLLSDLPAEEIKKQLLESSAYYKLYAMRGDQYTAKLFNDTMVDTYKKHYHLDKAFTEEDKTWIENRGKELYDHYQAERNRLGLGDFDNEVPKEVKDFFDE